MKKHPDENPRLVTERDIDEDFGLFVEDSYPTVSRYPTASNTRSRMAAKRATAETLHLPDPSHRKCNLYVHPIHTFQHTLHHTTLEG